jgi:hypothetical protein
MREFQDFKRKFTNNRQWREFVAAVHESVTYPCAVTYPKMISALQAGRDWFSGGAARTSNPASDVENCEDTLSLEQIKA